MPADYSSDVTAIETVIEALFAGITWSADRMPDWDGFRAQLHPATTMFPSARPCAPTTLEPFVAMMEGQRTSGAITVFEEDVTGHRIAVFGNIAVALSAYTQRINGGDLGRGVNGFLLIKQDGDWQIAAMCWDNARPDHPVPDDLA